MKPELKKVCLACSGTGIVNTAVDYPNLEVKQFCSQCLEGGKLSGRVAEIIARDIAKKEVA
jgi:DnaJ-class molecular chaperone